MAKPKGPFRWTRGRVELPAVGLKHDGAGIQARYYKLEGENRPPRSFGVPDHIPVGLKVYSTDERATRDTAVRMQEKLSREKLAPEVYAKVAVFQAGEQIGWGLVTEHILLGDWTGSHMDSSRARSYLLDRLPGFGDMHEGNYGFNPRTGMPQVVDMGDHGVRRLKWKRVPGARWHAERVQREERERAQAAADADRRRADREKRRAAARDANHKRRRERGDTHCHTCDVSL